VLVIKTDNLCVWFGAGNFVFFWPLLIPELLDSAAVKAVICGTG